MTNWEQTPPKFVGRFADINARIQIVTAELLKREQKKAETLVKLMEHVRGGHVGQPKPR